MNHQVIETSLGMKIFTFLCVLLLSVEGANVSSHSRALTLQCSDNQVNDTFASGESYEGFFDSYSRGSSARDLIRKLRQKPESYYQNVIDNMIMFSCDVETARERCVDENSPFAAKSWSEQCVKASDFECPEGKCERTSNCYWKSVHEDQNRSTRFPVESYENAETFLLGRSTNSYAGDVAYLSIIGVIISFALLLLWVVFFIGRYLCCCLWRPCGGLCFFCSPIPRKEGYHTCRDILIPIFIFILSLVVIVAASSIAFIGNEDISVAVINAFLHADRLVSDLMQFLGRSRIPLENINAIVTDAALDARGIFDGTEYVQNDALQIVNSFLGFHTLYSDNLNASNSLNGFDTATSGFDEKVLPITGNIQSMLDTLELDLHNKVDTIKGGLLSAMDQIDSFSELSLGWQTQIYQLEGQELGLRETRRLVVMIIFLISICFSILGFGGVIAARSKVCPRFFHMVKVTAFISTILGTISLLVASLLLCINFLLHDACQISDIITRDFEPYVGDKVAPGANACFNNTNLAVALNITEKLSFKNKLAEGIDEIEQINVSNSFQSVLDPLTELQSMLGSYSDTALSLLNEATASNDFPCAFNDTYTKENIVFPWNNIRPTNETSYVIRGTFGSFTTYDRVGLESGEDYMSRIYNIAGICTAQFNCCIDQNTTASCDSMIYAACDLGDNCVYPCETVRQGIVNGYLSFLQIYESEQRMTADLGLQCPSTFPGSCPTEIFRSQYSNLTLVDSISEYKAKISITKDSLVNLAETSVGGAMVEIDDFLCNMNVSFVKVVYDDFNEDMCGKMFGGIAQINFSFWILGISLEIIAIVCHVLAIRLTKGYQLDERRRLRIADIYD